MSVRGFIFTTRQVEAEKKEPGFIIRENFEGVDAIGGSTFSSFSSFLRRSLDFACRALLTTAFRPAQFIFLVFKEVEMRMKMLVLGRIVLVTVSVILHFRTE